MPVVLLIVAVAGLGLVRSGLRRPSRRGPLWFPAMVVSELAPWFLTATVTVGVVSFVAGWARGRAGLAGLAILAIDAAGLAVMIGRSLRARAAVIEAVTGFLGRESPIPGPGLRLLARPVSRPPPGVCVETGLRYGDHRRHVVDRIARDDLDVPAPAFVHIHGGGWTRGRRDSQARPLVHRMASGGWVVLTPTYRLSPEATFPDHVEDCSRLVGWIRSNADRLGVDAGFIALAGGSAGGQIAALGAIGSSGWEEVQACVPIYGVHELLDRTGTAPRWDYLAHDVLKSHPAQDPQRWAAASPIRAAIPARPPFFVVHGGSDTLVSPLDSTRLVAALRAVGGPPVGYLEVPWANHGFDYFNSIRSLLTAEAIAIVLNELYESAIGD